jgi:diamine N-acetyltransferase
LPIFFGEYIPKIATLIPVLEDDGFCENPFFRCFVSDDPTAADRLTGYVLFFFTYSTWEGRSVYMEDIYVTPTHRGQGIGVRLWKACVQVTVLSA